ncbi:hypothetical protein BDZ45DRAFT_718491 [Acephala macrosclerotiorum]|nr:hypothetical protein BDZ45DRAFT_718491 [Acephala macrosclerotiorum]
MNLTVSWGTSGYSPAEMEMEKIFGVSAEVGTLGLSIYVLGLALGPMTLMPLSENLGGFLVSKTPSGMFAAVTIAMSVFLWAATCGSPSGCFLFALVTATRGLRYTRHNIILACIHHKSTIKSDQTSLTLSQELRLMSNLFQKALKRPFLFLATQGIVQFASLYNGYLYGLSFLFNSAFVIVFDPQGHGFGTIDTRYYQTQIPKDSYKSNPEVRVMIAKIAGIYSSIYWIVLILVSALWGWSFYTLILMAYTFTEDSYKTYFASALAGIGLIRNVAGAGFPLFGTQILLAGLAVLMVPIPFILGSSLGVKLGQRSPWARIHIEGEGSCE